MANNSRALDGVFQALADPTRRAVIMELGKGPATVSQLKKPFRMALPSFLKHLRLLERNRLIRTMKSGRQRTCRLDTQTLAAAESWMSQQRALWEARADRLEALVTTLQSPESAP